MKLLKTSALSGLSAFIKILTGMFSLKIVSVYTGPIGVAILGQYMALVSTLSVIAGGGISLGVIKYAAEYANKGILTDFLPTAMAYTLFFSAITMLFGFIFSSSISIWILGSTEYSYLIKWVSASQLFIAVNSLFISLITGFGKIRLLVIVTFLSSFLSLSLIGLCSIFYHLQGALFAFVISQGMVVFISMAFIYREKWFGFLFSFKAKSRHWFNLSRYSFMSIVSTLTVPVAQILVRNDLSRLFGWESVGYWQAVLRLSDAYLLFVTTALTAYYLPRLSQLNTNQTLKHEISQAYLILMPILTLILVFLYVFRNFIIRLLYSESFIAADDLFLYQLMGDFFRIAGWLFTYLLLAKSWTKMYIATEVILSLLFIGISHIFARSYGLVGVTYAFALTYFIYWLLMMAVGTIYFKKESKSCQLVSDL